MTRKTNRIAFAKCEQILTILQIMNELVQSGDDSREEQVAAIVLLKGLTADVYGLIEG